MASSTTPGSRDPGDETARRAEAALRTFGYARVTPQRTRSQLSPQFWVQEGGVPRRTLPVFLQLDETASSARSQEEWARLGTQKSESSTPAIVVVPSERAAEEAWHLTRDPPRGSLDNELSILVVPTRREPDDSPHWHEGTVSPKSLLKLATGVVVGLFRRAQVSEGSSQIDFGEMLRLLQTRFRIDVNRSLGVSSDEEALFILYQLALRDSYAPGDPSSSLHLITLRPSGPAARLPWFAA